MKFVALLMLSAILTFVLIVSITLVIYFVKKKNRLVWSPQYRLVPILFLTSSVLVTIWLLFFRFTGPDATPDAGLPDASVLASDPNANDSGTNAKLDAGADHASGDLTDAESDAGTTDASTGFSTKPDLLFEEASKLESFEMGKALKLYRKSCRANNLASCTRSSVIILGGEHHTRKSGAILTLIKSCGLKYQPACSQLAFQLAERKIEELIKSRSLTTQTRDKAFTLLVENCTRGNHIACDAVGVAYKNGIGRRRSVAEAANFFERSCNLVKSKNKRLHPHGCANLATYYARGKGGRDRDAAKAEELYAFACERGIPWACYQLGQLLNSFIGGRKHKKAKSAFARACELGSEPSCSIME